jgi:cutinase
MNLPGSLRISSATVVTAVALLGGPIGVPAASADPCPNVEVVFARGTNEAPGLGFVGQVFVDSLRAQLPGRAVAAYAVNYPASDNYLSSASVGSTDARARIQSIVASCPNTSVVVGGYSQGASVTELSTSALPPAVGDRIAAVALFGSPSSEFSSMLAGGAPLPTVSPVFSTKTIDLCIPGDPICSAGSDMVAHVSYVPAGMANQAATFAASKVDQSIQ